MRVFGGRRRAPGLVIVGARRAQPRLGRNGGRRCHDDQRRIGVRHRRQRRHRADCCQLLGQRESARSVGGRLRVRARRPGHRADEGLCPTGVGNTPLAGFPTAGATYGILTSGNAAYADDPNTAGNTGYSWGVSGATSIGAGVFDYQVVTITLPPATTSCLAFDFRFLSDEYPEFVNTNYNDAFIAQLNTFSVARRPDHPDRQRTRQLRGWRRRRDLGRRRGSERHGRRRGPRHHLRRRDSVADRSGTRWLLVRSNTLYLTIFDQGDGILDSAAFVDNLHYENIVATKCKSLSLDPFDGTTGITPVAGKPAKLSKNLATLNVPVECQRAARTDLLHRDRAGEVHADRRAAPPRCSRGLPCWRAPRSPRAGRRSHRAPWATWR